VCSNMLLEAADVGILLAACWADVSFVISMRQLVHLTS